MEVTNQSLSQGDNIHGNNRVMFLSQQYKEMTGEKLTSGIKRRLGGLFKFEQYWEVCTEVTKAEFGFVSARFTRDSFKKMCATELEVLEENDRQCNFRTPSRPLVSDARCSVYPPDFRSVTSVDQQMSKPKLKFGCTKLPPQLYPTRVYELNEKMGVPCHTLPRPPVTFHGSLYVSRASNKYSLRPPAP